eukprot:gene6892-11054_t
MLSNAKGDKPKVNSARKDFVKTTEKTKKKTEETKKTEQKKPKSSGPNLEAIRAQQQKKKNEELKNQKLNEKEKENLKELEEKIKHQVFIFEEKYKPNFLNILSSPNQEKEEKQKSISKLKEILEEIEEIEDDDQFERLQNFSYQLIKIIKLERGFYLKTDTIENLILILNDFSKHRIPISNISLDSSITSKDLEIPIKIGKKFREFGLILGYNTTIEEDLDEKYIIQSKNTEEIIKRVQNHITSFDKNVPIFPCALEIINFKKTEKNIEVEVNIVDGRISISTPISMYIEEDEETSEDTIDFGEIKEIISDNKQVKECFHGNKAVIKFDLIDIPDNFGKNHFLYSKISRKSIDQLKSEFKDEITYQDAILIQKIKKRFNVE